MLRKVIMPTLGLDMEEAVIERWLKREGESVVKDEPLLLVETEKATTEIPAPATGVLTQIVQRAGATVPVTQTIALIQTSEPASASETAPVLPNGKPAAEQPASSPGNRLPPRSREGGGGRVLPLPMKELPLPSGEGRGEGSSVSPTEAKGVRASPAARKAAKELGVDLARVQGSGPAGRIQGEDVRRFAEGAGRPPAAEAPATPAGLPGRLVPLGRKRRVTAERMALSARSVARLTLNLEVDAGEMIRLRARLQPSYENRGARLSYDAVLVKAIATALAEHPYLNARWTDRGILLVDPINVGVAVAVEDGLVVPVISDAGRKGLQEIAAELGRMLAKAREDKLTLGEMTGGTFTLTNLGMFGIDSFTPIVNPPESAILGVGRIAEKPVGWEGQIMLRPRMALALSVDHRVVDGAPAARFLQRIQQLLEDPHRLL